MNEQRNAYDSSYQQPRVIIVGNLTIDDIVLPDGTTQMSRLGGNSLYSALGARLWQPSVGVVTRRGEDFPHDLNVALSSLNIATQGVVDIPGPTVRNWVVYENDGRRNWIYRTPRERSKEVAVQPGDVPGAWLMVQPAPVVHIASMPLDAAEAIITFIRHTAPHSIITLDTHEDYVIDYQQRLRALAARVDAFLPSRSELADLVGYDNPHRALASLSNLPTPIIVIKMGANGVLLWDKKRGTLHEVDIAPGPVIDVTGAGDAFCGGFAAGLSLGVTPLEAAQRGTIAASYTVADFGSLRLAHVDLAEAQQRIHNDPPAVRLLSTTVVPTSIEVAGTDRDISSSVEAMRGEIAMIPTILTQQLETLPASLVNLAQTLHGRGIEYLYLVGCGDSAFAGAAAALAFQKHAGIPCEGIHALDMARYRVRYLPPGSAVLCISFSGKVGRTIEAAKQARRFGHRVIAFTGNPESSLAREADDTIVLSVPTLGYSPGTSTYLAIVASLLALAVEWGEVRKNNMHKERMLLKLLPELAHQTLEEVNVPIQELAERMIKQNYSWLTFLGAGPNLATAKFGAAKMFEGPQKLGVSTNIEEWAHEEYFVSGAGTPVFLIAPTGASFDRANEILSELNFIGADSVFIGDARPSVAPGTFLPIASGLTEAFTPLLTALPLSLFAFHLTLASGQGQFDFPSPEVAKEHYETIYRITQGEPA